MHLIFLGSGAAFTVGCNNYHSNMLLQDDEGHLLMIDCGSDARLSLHELGFSHRDIHDVYISHLHADHVGGLEWLAFSTKFDPQGETKPNLYLCEQLADDIWNKVLAGGLSSLRHEKANLSTYFNVIPVKTNGTFEWYGHQIQLIRTKHVMCNEVYVPSHGLMFNANGINVLITTDTQFVPNEMEEWYDKADLIFHDCETNSIKSGVHSHYEDLITLPMQVKRKTWLYHYNTCEFLDAVKEGFLGFVKKGQSFDFKNRSTLGI